MLEHTHAPHTISPRHSNPLARTQTDTDQHNWGTHHISDYKYTPCICMGNGKQNYILRPLLAMFAYTQTYSRTRIKSKRSLASTDHYDTRSVVSIRQFWPYVSGDLTSVDGKLSVVLLWHTGTAYIQLTVSAHPAQNENNPETALASLQPWDSDVCKYMENSEVWERIHFTLSPYVLFGAPGSLQPFILLCHRYLQWSSSPGQVHKIQVQPDSNRSIAMNRAPSSVVCRVWESWWRAFSFPYLMLWHRRASREAVGLCFQSREIFTSSKESLFSRQCQTKELNPSCTSPEVQWTSAVGREAGWGGVGLGSRCDCLQSWGL